MDSAKPAFIREVLVKCRRLCYHQRIVETVPQDFEPLLPNEPNIRFKYRHDDDDEMSENPAAACSRKLEYAFRSELYSRSELILSSQIRPDLCVSFKTSLDQSSYLNLNLSFDLNLTSDH